MSDTIIDEDGDLTTYEVVKYNNINNMEHIENLFSTIERVYLFKEKSGSNFHDSLIYKKLKDELCTSTISYKRVMKIFNCIESKYDFQDRGERTLVEACPPYKELKDIVKRVSSNSDQHTRLKCNDNNISFIEDIYIHSNEMNREQLRFAINLIESISQYKDSGGRPIEKCAQYILLKKEILSDQTNFLTVQNCIKKLMAHDFQNSLGYGIHMCPYFASIRERINTASKAISFV